MNVKHTNLLASLAPILLPASILTSVLAIGLAMMAALVQGLTVLAAKGINHLATKKEAHVPNLALNM